MAIRQSTSYSASPSPPRPSHHPEDIDRGTPGEIDDSNYIEKSILLDTAFLHSIATHRPIGPHKHFNVIPILLNLDRTARQVGARIRDDGYIRGASGDDDGGGGGGEGSTTRSIKKEEVAEGEEDNATTIAFASLPVNSQMIWLRLDQLYNVGGLEELENLAVDNDAASPFRNGHSLYHRISSIQIPPAASTTTRFGFGSSLEKRKKANTAATPKSARKKVAAAAAAAAEDEDEAAAADHTGLLSEEQVEFELGPWDEYESLIAPRRLKSYAPQEDGQSESEEDLSEPSEAEANDDVVEEEQPDEEVLSEGEDEGDVDGEEVEEGEDEDGEEEEADTSTSKRKASSKKQSAPSKKAKKASSPTVKSKATRQSAKPRRSTRR